ncbi:MAG: TRAP transporter large permease subunit [Rhizobiales bacterium]|nr:TRAP transporter large permease subunit [Hyphomicrobiales bacterium]
MSPTFAGVVGLVVLFVLFFFRMPIGVSLLLVGGVGFAALTNWPAASALLGSEPFHVTSAYALSVIPLFVLMGHFATLSGMARDFYAAAYAWIGPWRGGLAGATIVACSGFSALSGSSVATAATIGQVALPEMRRYRYDPRLATGAVAAGGTLGILIPPSTGMVVYAILTEQSIGQLFVAGILPGVLLTVMFMITISAVCLLCPSYGPPGKVQPIAQRAAALLRALPMLGIVLVTIGGIYLGFFTPTEAAAVGAFLAMLLAVVRRALTFGALLKVLLESVRTSGLVFLILIGATLFSQFISVTRIPGDLAQFLIGLNLPKEAILTLILSTYIVLGTFLEGFAMLVLTLPVVFPIITTLGYDPIWFGVVMVLVLEMGLISPPLGVNVFVVKGVAGDVPMSQIFVGILPFWAAMIVTLVILVLVPDIALLLPKSMFR